MKSNRLRALSAAGIALGLLIVGAFGPFRAGSSSGDEPTSSQQAEDYLGPAVSVADLDVAIGALQASLRNEPDDAGALATLGLAYIQKARVSADPSYYPKAEKVLTRSLELEEATNFEAMLGMGALDLARHDFAGALDWGRRAKRINPDNASIRGVIGDAYLELGLYDEADRAFQRMVNLRPDLSSYARASYARELRGDVRGAIRFMKLAEGAAGTSSDAAWAGYQLGELYFSSGRHTAASFAYRQGSYLDPSSVLPRLGIAKIAAARGDFQRATTILERVTRRQPLAEYVILLGDLYRASGRVDEAAGQYELVAAVEKLYRSNGVNVDLEQALFDADHGNADRALEVARTEYERRPSVHVADALAWAHYASGDYTEARRYSKEALRLGTRSALFQFHAGMIAVELGHTRVARRHLTTALDINPSFSFVHAAKAAETLEELESSR
ncbi:MAG: tetratricopeptide repeat protein [Actinomycetota bacterium]